MISHHRCIVGSGLVFHVCIPKRPAAGHGWVACEHCERSRFIQPHEAVAAQLWEGRGAVDYSHLLPFLATTVSVIAIFLCKYACMYIYIDYVCMYACVRMCAGMYLCIYM